MGHSGRVSSERPGKVPGQRGGNQFLCHLSNFRGSDCEMKGLEKGQVIEQLLGISSLTKMK